MKTRAAAERELMEGIIRKQGFENVVVTGRSGSERGRGRQRREKFRPSDVISEIETKKYMIDNIQTGRGTN